MDTIKMTTLSLQLWAGFLARLMDGLYLAIYAASYLSLDHGVVKRPWGNPRTITLLDWNLVIAYIMSAKWSTKQPKVHRKYLMIVIFHLGITSFEVTHRIQS